MSWLEPMGSPVVPAGRPRRSSPPVIPAKAPVACVVVAHVVRSAEAGEPDRRATLSEIALGT